MTIPARTWQGQPITLTALENYERTYLGSDGYLYVDIADENPTPLEFGSGYWNPPHDSLQEFRVHEINFKRLKRLNESSEELTTDEGEGCVMYEVNVNGNLLSEHDSPEKAVDALMLEILPVGSRIYLADDYIVRSDQLVNHQRWFTLKGFDSNSVEVYGIVAKSQESDWVSASEAQIDWDKTFAWLEKQGAL